MAIPRYSPPLERIKEEYSRMVRRKVMAARRPPTEKPRTPIPDNSTPWIENPTTIADLLFISDRVRELEEQWGPKTG